MMHFGRFKEMHRRDLLHACLQSITTLLGVFFGGVFTIQNSTFLPPFWNGQPHSTQNSLRHDKKSERHYALFDFRVYETSRIGIMK